MLFRAVGLFALLAGMCLAAPIVRPPPALTSSFGTSLTYDDNLFRYSGFELDTFRIGNNPARFPIRTSDDLDVSLWGKWSYRFRLAEIQTRTSVSTKWHGFVSNWEKSYGLAEAGIAGTLPNRNEAGVSFLWMPSYLVRYFRKPRAQTAEYIGCRFAEYLVKVYYAARLSSFLVRPDYRYQYDNYLSVFDYYDTRAHRFGCLVGFAPVSGLSLEADYHYKLASATGPVPDISYRQHELRTSLRTSAGKSRFSMEVEYEVDARAYTTRNPARIDSTHAGRKDMIEAMSLQAGYRVGRNRIFLRYEMNWRNVSSPYSAAIEEEKQYRQNRLGLGVVLNPATPY